MNWEGYQRAGLRRRRLRRSRADRRCEHRPRARAGTKLELPVDTAIMVNEAQKASPAAQAGIVSGDIIVAFEATPIAGIDELHRLLTAEAANRPATLTILRGVERKELQVTPLPKEE